MTTNTDHDAKVSPCINLMPKVNVNLAVMAQSHFSLVKLS
jgi:hypothetical protein